MIETIQRFYKMQDDFRPKKIRGNALRFDEDFFKQKIKAFIEQKYWEFKRNE